MTRTLKTVALVAVVLLAARFLPEEGAGVSPGRSPATESSQAQTTTVISRAEDERMITVHAPVLKVLPDDNKGSRHQRFLIELASGQTVLVAHNIDIAPRVPSLQRGDRVTLFGQFEWTEKGGVLHWTHHAPRRDHVGGWIEHNGQRYE